MSARGRDGTVAAYGGSAGVGSDVSTFSPDKGRRETPGARLCSRTVIQRARTRCINLGFRARFRTSERPESITPAELYAGGPGTGSAGTGGVVV